METSHIEQSGVGEPDRDALRHMILQTEEDIRRLHETGEGNKGGLGAVEMWRAFPYDFKKFLDDADNILPLSLEERQELNRLIQAAANGTLGEPEHVEELNHLLDFFMRYRQARPELRH